MQNIRISVLAIIVITLAVGGLVALINGIAYSRHLDRVVSGEERNVHTRIVEPGSAMSMVLIGLLCIWVLTSLTKISTLNDRVEQLRMDMNNRLNSLQDQVVELEEKLDAQSAIISDYEFSFGAIDKEQRTVSMQFRAVLKSYEENSRVFLNFGTQSAELNNENGAFTGSIPVGLFQVYPNPPVLEVKTGSVTQTQTLEDCPYGTLAELCLPTLLNTMDEFTVKEDKQGNLTVYGQVSIMEEGDKVEGVSITGADVVMKLGEEEQKRIPLNFVDGRVEEMRIDSSFPNPDNRRFTICLETRNDLGWVVSQAIACYDPMQQEMVYIAGDLSVADQNGVTMFGIETES